MPYLIEMQLYITDKGCKYYKSNDSVRINLKFILILLNCLSACANIKTITAFTGLIVVGNTLLMQK